MRVFGAIIWYISGHNNIVLQRIGGNCMSKDSQLDPKEVRKRKAGGDKTMAASGNDGESKNAKKQSGNRAKSGDDKK